MDKKKILIIDDEKDLCELMKLNLESMGKFEVTVAYSGQEGIKKAKETNFDLVISDFSMPGMDGKEVLETLKNFNPLLPVVLFTVYHDDVSTIPRSIKSKADGLINKPIDHEQLYKTINGILEKNKGR